MKYLYNALLILFSSSIFSQHVLVKDFDNTNASSIDYYDEMLFTLNEHALFRICIYNTETSTTELQLWSTDGTTNGTVKLVSVPNFDESTVRGFYDFKYLSATEVAFVAINGSDYEIWSTDGTEANTHKLHTRPDFIMLEVLNNNIYFVSYDNNLYENLYKLDLSNSNAISSTFNFGFSHVLGINKVSESKLIVVARDVNNANSAFKVFTSDGTTIGTVALNTELYFGSIFSQQTVMTKVGNNVYFFIQEAGGDDNKNFLWVTDGTDLGTIKLREFNQVYFYDYFYENAAKVIDGKFYFMAVDKDLSSTSANNRTLWVSDGTVNGTIPLHNNTLCYNPKEITPFNNKIYFTGYSSTTYNYHVYETDGTVANTRKVNLQYASNSVSSSGTLEATDSTLFFSGRTFTNGDELFSLDVDGDVHVYEMPETDECTPTEMLSVNNTLVFHADFPATGRELYKLGTMYIEVGTRDALSTQHVSVFPNPATNEINISSNKFARYEIGTTQGLLVHSGNHFPIDVSNIPVGFYQLKLIADNETVVYQKIQIMR